jgi:hypothetical protein
LQDQKSFESGAEPNDIATQVFELITSYTDKGSSGIAPINVKKSVAIIPARFYIYPIIDFATADKLIEKARHKRRETVKLPATGAWISVPLGKYDLTSITALRIGAWATLEGTAWQFELRSGSATGAVIAKGENPSSIADTYVRTELKLQAQSGYQDLYLVIRSNGKSESELHLLDASFHR